MNPAGMMSLEPHLRPLAMACDAALSGGDGLPELVALFYLLITHEVVFAGETFNEPGGPPGRELDRREAASIVAAIARQPEAAAEDWESRIPALGIPVTEELAQQVRRRLERVGCRLSP